MSTNIFLKSKFYNLEGTIMFKKILKVVLLVMMLFGAFIVVTNLTAPDLHGGFHIATYYPEIPDCKDFEKDCNVFTAEEPVQ